VLHNDEGGGTRSRFTLISVGGVYLCNISMENCVDYSRVVSWPISLASSESDFPSVDIFRINLKMA
jgi:hypothetical protein